MADRLSTRLDKEHHADDDARVLRVFQFVYGRTPDTRERELARGFVKRHGWPAFCRVLFNSNEFVQVD